MKSDQFEEVLVINAKKKKEFDFEKAKFDHIT
jgi:hypothetical protein